MPALVEGKNKERRALFYLCACERGRAATRQGEKGSSINTATRCRCRPMSRPMTEEEKREREGGR